MSDHLIDPNPVERYIDKDGRLTLEGLQLFIQLLATVRDHEARIEALEP